MMKRKKFVVLGWISSNEEDDEVLVNVEHMSGIEIGSAVVQHM